MLRNTSDTRSSARERARKWSPWSGNTCNMSCIVSVGRTRKEEILAACMNYVQHMPLYCIVPPKRRSWPPVCTTSNSCPPVPMFPLGDPSHLYALLLFPALYCIDSLHVCALHEAMQHFQQVVPLLPCPPASPGPLPLSLSHLHAHLEPCSDAPWQVIGIVVINKSRHISSTCLQATILCLPLQQCARSLLSSACLRGACLALSLPSSV